MLDQNRHQERTEVSSVQPVEKRPSIGLLSRMKRHAVTGASALALIAVLGTASLTVSQAMAVGEQAAQQAIEPQAPAQRMPSFAPLVQRVKPAVVSIRVKEEATPQLSSNENTPFGDNQENPFEGTPFERFFNDPNGPFAPFFRNQPGGKGWKRVIMAQGSGFFISSDGYIVTNNHVVDNAVTVEVVTDDGKTYKAKVVGTDPRTDLALLKVDAGKDFPYVKLSNADVKVGDWVVAMGNPFGLGGTVTAGIVSARGRDIGEGPYDDFLQIDAPVNKGNSGGPTFNQDGEVVGVNTAIYSPSGGSVGIAFAIPSQIVQKVTAQLKEQGHVTRGWLGVQIQPLTPELADSLGIKETEGALVSSVQDNSPAEKAGLKSGDVITRLNGQAVKDARDLARKVANIAPNTEVKLAILRDGESQDVTLKLGELKEKQAQQQLSEDEPSSKSKFSELGLRLAPASKVAGSGDHGVVVMSVEPGSPAAEAGLAEGDIILKIAGQKVETPAELERVFRKATEHGKDHALALVERKGSQLFIALPSHVG